MPVCHMVAEGSNTPASRAACCAASQRQGMHEVACRLVVGISYRSRSFGYLPPTSQPSPLYCACALIESNNGSRAPHAVDVLVHKRLIKCTCRSTCQLAAAARRSNPWIYLGDPTQGLAAAHETRQRLTNSLSSAIEIRWYCH